jgi:hypothetical protein
MRHEREATEGRKRARGIEAKPPKRMSVAKYAKVMQRIARRPTRSGGRLAPKTQFTQQNNANKK